jgi:hypothetical protein
MIIGEKFHFFIIMEHDDDDRVFPIKAQEVDNCEPCKKFFIVREMFACFFYVKTANHKNQLCFYFKKKLASLR